MRKLDSPLHHLLLDFFTQSFHEFAEDKCKSISLYQANKFIDSFLEERESQASEIVDSILKIRESHENHTNIVNNLHNSDLV